MPRVHFVKAARKDNRVAKKGEPYYWWKFRTAGRGGSKCLSATPPKRWQLTQSDYYSQAYQLADEGLPSCESADDLRNFAEEVRQLGSEQQEKFDNMPDGLQQGDTGQLLEERSQECETWADEIDQAADELPDEPEDRDATEEGEDETAGEKYDAALEAAKDDLSSSCPW